MHDGIGSHGTPPGQTPPPLGRHPHWADPPGQTPLGRHTHTLGRHPAHTPNHTHTSVTVNGRTVHILLECILVTYSKDGNITALTNIEPLAKRDIKYTEQRNINGQKQSLGRKSTRQIISKSTSQEAGDHHAISDSCAADETEAA